MLPGHFTVPLVCGIVRLINMFALLFIFCTISLMNVTVFEDHLVKNKILFYSILLAKDVTFSWRWMSHDYGITD